MNVSDNVKLSTLKKNGAKIIDLLGEIFLPRLWKIKDAFSIVYSSAKDSAFQDFLEGIAFKFSINNLTESDIEQMTVLISDNSNNQFLTNILDSVFFSKSKICRNILGILAGKFLIENEVDYEDLTLSVALKDLFDNDLMEFNSLYKMTPSKSNIDDQTIFIGNYSSTQRIIVEKLQNSGILGRDLALNRLAGSGVPPLRYNLTSVSHRLFEYLESVISGINEKI